MKRVKAYSLVFIAICIVFALSAFKRGFFKASASKKGINFPVNNLVPSLTIVDIRVQRDLVVLSLRNDYNKNITAFAVSSSGITTRTEMIGTDGVLAPGAIKTKSYELPSPSSPEYALTVQAALFEDNTADGSQEIIKQIVDARAGEKRQIDRILPILQDSMEVLSVPSKQKWQLIRSRIARLPDLEEGESFEFRTGLSNAKNLALLKINDLEQLQRQRGSEIAWQEWANIKERYETRNTMLLEHLPKNHSLR